MAGDLIVVSKVICKDNVGKGFLETIVMMGCFFFGGG